MMDSISMIYIKNMNIYLYINFTMFKIRMLTILRQTASVIWFTASLLLKHETRSRQTPEIRRRPDARE